MQRFVMKKKTLHQMLVKSGVASGLPLLLSLGIVQPALAQASSPAAAPAENAAPPAPATRAPDGVPGGNGATAAQTDAAPPASGIARTCSATWAACAPSSAITGSR